MKYSIFPGCLVSYRFPSYEKSANLVLKRLGYNVTPINSFSCCGSQILESINERDLHLLNARNLSIAQDLEINTLITLCGSCTYIIKKSLSILLEDRLELMKVNEKLSDLDLQFSPKKKINVTHIAEFLNKESIFDNFRKSIIKSIDINIAIQNPCMLLRPNRISNLELKDRLMIYKLMKECGANIISYKYTNRCCGGTMLAFDKPIAKDLGVLRYDILRELNVDLLVVGCPNCQLMYSIYQNMLNDISIPSIFFTQLIGLALDYSINEMALERNIQSDKIIEIINKSKVD
ncbi:MAG: hypothetical protein GF329_17550 [Candidatus Lokiarchaeota archaeon]|nr:hypothetical protein [Candidatus Lokiarchaeota archaeon]